MIVRQNMSRTAHKKSGSGAVWPFPRCSLSRCNTVPFHIADGFVRTGTRPILSCSCLRLGYLGSGHASLQTIPIFSGIFVSLRCCEIPPLICLNAISTDTITFDIHQAESVLRLCVALFGGFSAPARSFNIVLRDAFAVAMRRATWQCLLCFRNGPRWPAWLSARSPRIAQPGAMCAFVGMVHQESLSRHRAICSSREIVKAAISPELRSASRLPTIRATSYSLRLSPSAKPRSIFL